MHRAGAARRRPPARRPPRAPRRRRARRAAGHHRRVQCNAAMRHRSYHRELHACREAPLHTSTRPCRRVAGPERCAAHTLARARRSRTARPHRRRCTLLLGRNWDVLAGGRRAVQRYVWCAIRCRRRHTERCLAAVTVVLCCGTAREFSPP
jgi:hypothetical protein